MFRNNILPPPVYTYYMCIYYNLDRGIIYYHKLLDARKRLLFVGKSSICRKRHIRISLTPFPRIYQLYNNTRHITESSPSASGESKRNGRIHYVPVVAGCCAPPDILLLLTKRKSSGLSSPLYSFRAQRRARKHVALPLSHMCVCVRQKCIYVYSLYNISL